MPDDNKNQIPDYDPENPRCDQEQLKFLKDCISEGPEGIKKWNKWYKDEDPEIWLQKANLSKVNLQKADLREAHLQIANLWHAQLEGASLMEAHLEGAILRVAHLEGAALEDAHLEGANLRRAHLEGADLIGAHLEGAGLTKAHLEGADLEGTHLEGAKLMEANLEGTTLRGNHLQGADFSRSIVDGKTLVWGCEVDCKTKVEAVGLDSMRIYPATKQLLEYNIRKSNWSLWYNRLWNRNLFTKIISSPLVPIKWILVRPFWFISDYGISTMRILITFSLLAFVYAIVYFHRPGCVYIYGHEAQFDSFLHALYFSVVTMTTLGFGDIAANPNNDLGLILLMSQVILGYVLLGALVTRFAVLFTAGGPAGKFTPIHPKVKLLIKRINYIRKAVIPRKERKKNIQLWCKLSQEISDGKYRHSEE